MARRRRSPADIRSHGEGKRSAAQRTDPLTDVAETDRAERSRVHPRRLVKHGPPAPRRRCVLDGRGLRADRVGRRAAAAPVSRGPRRARRRWSKSPPDEGDFGGYFPDVRPQALAAIIVFSLTPAGEDGMASSPRKSPMRAGGTKAAIAPVGALLIRRQLRLARSGSCNASARCRSRRCRWLRAYDAPCCAVLLVDRVERVQRAPVRAPTVWPAVCLPSRLWCARARRTAMIQQPPAMPMIMRCARPPAIGLLFLEPRGRTSALGDGE